MQAAHPAITEAVYGVLSVDASVASRTSEGGTAPENVRREARKWIERLETRSRMKRSAIRELRSRDLPRDTRALE
jgi:argininosuccinate lyase